MNLQIMRYWVYATHGLTENIQHMNENSESFPGSLTSTIKSTNGDIPADFFRL